MKLAGTAVQSIESLNVTHVMMVDIGFLKPVRARVVADHDRVVTSNLAMMILKLLINIYA